VTVLITGGNGKVGRALAERYVRAGKSVRLSAREAVRPMANLEGAVATGAYSAGTDFAPALRGVEAVIHAASLTWHPESDATEAFERANVAGARRLATQAVEQGVKRLVYVSSLTVNGKKTNGHAFTHSDAAKPETPYSVSKARAEDALRDIAAATGLEVTIVRPPRIIWPELGGNLKQLAALVRRGVPVPFGAVSDNARDNVSIHNLLSLIEAAVDHPRAAGETFLVSDNDPLSTRELIERLGRHVGRQARLVSVPKAMLRAIVNAAPQRLRGRLTAAELSDELLGDLRVDIGHTRETLGWEPGAPVLR